MVAMDLALVVDLANLLASACAGGLVIVSVLIAFGALVKVLISRNWWPL